jgi:hypothetical protein
MHRLFLCFAVIHVSSAVAGAANDYDYVRVSEPRENTKFAKITDVSGSGHLFMADIERADDLKLRARLYRPSDGNFDVAADVDGEFTGAPNDKGSCRFKFDFNAAEQVDNGTYLLVVEFTKKNGEPIPKRIGSASQFLTIGDPDDEELSAPDEIERPAPKRPNAGGKGRIDDHEFIQIAVPFETDRYGAGIANIAGMGHLYYPDRKKVEVRIRLLRPATGKFEFVQQTYGEIGADLPGRPGLAQFGFDLKRNGVLVPGKYLIRADCLEAAGDEPKLIATSSVFLSVVE